ncbi:SAP domain-containing protein, putative isoform 2 [Hibiscus syriacus]|uniref:SAP domain-containing protein, putative isoform 2 n=1 Tax=Hibiscus syriacus TaxID=106335 RepID=A0A6A3C8G7_HIBSY|nr:SAP domain-containing protein, putative isoform 2 [Hibiscus syriacus]
MANKKDKGEGNVSDDNDGTESDEALCNRVINILKGGDLDSLSLKELKAYLRNHGLRITGTKAVCQQRILEHWESDESVSNRIISILKEGGDLESLSLKELKTYLRNHGLRITGTKAVCIQRILEHWREETEEEQKEEDKGSNSDYNDGIEDDESLCNRALRQCVNREFMSIGVQNEEEEKEEGNNDQTKNDESLCNRVVAILKEGGDLESLSMKELKAYLRNHGLRITGTKAVCQQRIHEHWSGVQNEEEEKEEGNNDQTKNDESLCNRVVAILKEGGDLESLSMKELKAYLRNHGLRITGSKAMCQQRILEHWSGDETGEEEEEERNNVNYNDRTENDDSLCNQVIAILKGGDFESLSLKELKAYLRNHGLLITGTKAVCQQRILEHWRIKDGNAEALYPKSSFFIDCSGDVCKGDVVLFTQKLYKKSDMTRRHVRLLEKRTIAGRVVKESYGKAKQQHTFTVEVLWSKGTKKFPPLFPLLVKGRNLYKSRTCRQRWCDEAERRNVLAEKHKRGNAARLVKEIERIRVLKGRNLYKSRTYRQLWCDEAERRNVCPGKRKREAEISNVRPGKRKREAERRNVCLGKRKRETEIRNVGPGKRKREAERRNVCLEKRKRHAARLVKEIERKRKWSADVGTKHPRHSHQSRPLKNREATEPERGRIDVTHTKELTPRLWYTHNVYQVSSPVGQLKKKQKSRCGSKDHFLRCCPGKLSATSVPSEGLSDTSMPSERPTSNTKQYGDICTGATCVLSVRPIQRTRQEGDVGTSAASVLSERLSAMYVPSERPSTTYVPSVRPTPTTQKDGDVGTKHQKHSHQSRRLKKRKASELEKGKIDKALGKAPIPRDWNTANVHQVSSPVRQVKKKQKSRLRVSKCNHCGKWHSGECRRALGVCFRCGSNSHIIRSCPVMRGATSVPSKRMTATSVPSEKPTPTIQQDGDVGMSVTSVPSERSTPTTQQNGDVGTSATSVPSERPNAGGLVGGSSVPKCDYCGSRHSGECWRMLGACFKCGSKDHFFRFCPGRISATSVPSESPILTTQRGMSPGNSGNTGGKQRVAKEEKPVHSIDDIGFIHQSNADPVLNSYQPQQNFHHQSAPHQFAGNAIGSTSTMVRSLPYRPYTDPRAVPTSTKPVHSTDDVGVIHHSNANLVLNSYRPQQNFHHQSSPHQFAGNDIGSTSRMVRSLPYRPCMDPRTIPGTKPGHSTHDLGLICHSNADPFLNSYQLQQNFHHQSAPQQLAGNDIGSMERSLPYRPYMDPWTIPSQYQGFSNHNYTHHYNSNPDFCNR